MNEDPDSDFPWTLYFQGEAMPRWANCWHFQPMPDNNVDWYVGQVLTRVDHAGAIESEHAEVFTIAAQQVLLTLLERKEAFIRELDRPPPERAGIYEGLLSGLQRMLTISVREEVVFWTSGYARDQEKLKDAIRRYRLGPTHPDYFRPPHEVRRQDERLLHLNLQRKKLRGRAATAGLPKALKRYLQELKDRESGK